jgi:hypothetical protein
LIIKKNNTKEYENEDDPNDDEFNLINSAIWIFLYQIAELIKFNSL